MGVITGYPDDTTTTADDKLLTVDASGATKLTSASTIKTYVENNKTPGSTSKADIAAGAVDKTKIDYTTSGGVWWEEIGRTTLASTNATISVTVPAKRYIEIRCLVVGTATTIAPILRFNGDTGNTYVYRSSINGGADSSNTSQSSIPAYVFTGAASHSFNASIFNMPSNEKHIDLRISTQYGNGAASIQDRREIAGRWTNVSNQVTTITISTTASTFATGSEIVVLGHD